MKINFFLPQVYRGIAGGYKVVYQYSNYLASKGHDVYIYYDLNDGNNSKHIPKFIARIIRKISFIGYPRWYKLDQSIKQSAVKNFNKEYIRNADISIATAPGTAYSVSKLPESKGTKFYFIQGYENWGKVSNDYVNNSYNLGMNNIVISNWLKEIVDKYGKKESKIVPNGLNLKNFKINTPIEKRNPFSICMLYSKGEIKGSKYGIEILKKLKNDYPELEVNLFSSDKKPKSLPKWINYTRNASEEAVISLLNNSAVYICTSLFEGFGLPGLESMACGCALVTTNCLGIMEYANNNNSMISEPKDAIKMYDNIKALLEDNNLRVSIASNGNKSIQNRDLEDSEKNFESYIINTTKMQRGENNNE